MRFSGKRIQLLNNKNTQEEFIAAYTDPYLLVSNSNYIDWERYDSLEISFVSGSNHISYAYNLPEGRQKTWTNDVYWKIKIRWLKVDSINTWGLTVSFVPYQLWCQFGSWNTAYVKVSVNDDSDFYCFKISSQLWRLISIKCDEMDY